MVEVTQADREAAWPFRPSGYGPIDRKAWDSGVCDHNQFIQAFARHRIAEGERCAGIAERYNFGPEKTERDNARNATSQMIAQAIREQSNGA